MTNTAAITCGFKGEASPNMLEKRVWLDCELKQDMCLYRVGGRHENRPPIDAQMMTHNTSTAGDLMRIVYVVFCLSKEHDVKIY